MFEEIRRNREKNNVQTKGRVEYKQKNETKENQICANNKTLIILFSGRKKWEKKERKEKGKRKERKEVKKFKEKEKKT